MIFDAEAYAEGICNSAAGSSIETFVGTLDALIDDVIDDAIYYRRCDDPDDTGEDAENDNAQAEGYGAIADDLRALREAIVELERANGEGTHFGSDD